MKEPVDHILRPRLPWRSESDPAITECGFNAAQVKAITRVEFFQRVKDMGRQRAAMVTCMTCLQTAERWSTWEEDPRHALEREIYWEGTGKYYRNEKRGHRLRDELLAIASLIEAHPDEFKTLIEQHQARLGWIEKKDLSEAARRRKGK
jgi:hypothetical protein